MAPCRRCVVIIQMVRDCRECGRSYVYRSGSRVVTKSRLCRTCRKQLSVMKRKPDVFADSELFQRLLEIEG